MPKTDEAKPLRPSRCMVLPRNWSGPGIFSWLCADFCWKRQTSSNPGVHFFRRRNDGGRKQDPKSLENHDLGTITGNFVKNFPIGSNVKLLLQPEDLEHDDKSNLQLDVVDKKFKGTNFIYTLKTSSQRLISVFVHSHHVHQHQINDKFGIKKPIHIKHLVCFSWKY